MLVLHHVSPMPAAYLVYMPQCLRFMSIILELEWSIPKNEQAACANDK